MATLALCIPAFNAEKYLPQLLRSARAQVPPFDEILVYNDASTDGTEAVAREFGARVVNGDINQGCSFGKNQLGATTSCEWIHFHDADDDILPGMTEKVHDWIATSDGRYEVLLLNFNYVDHENGRLLGKADHVAGELHRDSLRYAITHKIVNFGVYNTKAFRAAGGFDLDENVLYNEDNAFHQRLARQGLRFDYMPQVTCVNYRYRESMSASNRLKCARANYYVLAKTAESHGKLYAVELATQMWLVMASLASQEDWAYVRKALTVCRQLGVRHAPGGGLLLRILSRVDGFFAIWFREKMIRLFKPRYRVNV